MSNLNKKAGWQSGFFKLVNENQHNDGESMSILNIYFKLVLKGSSWFMWLFPCDCALRANNWACKKLDRQAVVKVI